MQKKLNLEVILDLEDNNNVSNKDAIIMWLRIGLGMASLTVSYQFRTSGLIFGILFLSLAFSINFITCRIILE